MTDSANTNSQDTNPLLASEGLPRFAEIKPEHVKPAITKLLEDATATLEHMESNIEPTWDSLFTPMEGIEQQFELAWKPIGHLLGVRNSEELRQAHESVLADVVKFGLRVRQSEPIYKAMVELRNGPNWEQLAPAQQRILTERIQDATLSGIGLEGDQRTRFNEITQQLSELATSYANNVLDAIKAYSLVIKDPNDAAGWPASLKNLAAQSFNHHKSETEDEGTPESGPWRITLEVPIFVPFMKHCRNQSLREEVYRAFISKASDGEYDNTENCKTILQLRKEQAALLGYDNYAEVSLSQKMAETVDAVNEMSETLRGASIDAAKNDLQELEDIADEFDFPTPIKHWDLAFLSERLREKRFDFTEEELRPYFQHEHVLDGMFALAERIFAISVEPADGEAPVWNDDVRYFRVLDSKSGEPIAAFYYDPYSRPADKRGGAWMDVCINRRVIDGQVKLPVAYLVCNATPPVGETPSLMTFREVETLFHEFGHGLQHMLTTVDFADAAGINGVEWDAVELPSQFMENWCYHRPTLLGMTKHIKTGEPLPDDLYNKIVGSRFFQIALQTLRQLTFGMTDMTLHSEFDPDGDVSVFDVQRQVMGQTSVMPMLPEDRMLCSFQHIFAGGYAAGYYSYKWAEVLSADAFSAFEEAGLDNDGKLTELGLRFRNTVLSKGGSEHPMDVFKDFRGREPDPQALLKQCGLLAND